MKAAIIHAAGDLRVEDFPDAEPGPREVAVRIRAGGICGSDLHYFNHGGFGTVRLRQPMVLGHEIAGIVEAVGADVTHVAAGDTVAVNPSLACGTCSYCLAARPNHCLDMRFFGSAMRMPHVHGGFRERLVCEQARCVPCTAAPERAAFAEPLAVCLHAVRQAGPLLGQRVLVTGAGPIGTLAVMAARHAGAAEITVCDLVSEPLAIARRVGADRVHDLSLDPSVLRQYEVDRGWFDVVLEASGSAAATTAAIAVVRPGGTIVQIGNGAGEATLPINAVVAKEVTLRGTFRFTDEFEWAVRLLETGLDVGPLLTHTVPLAEAERAFALAGNRRLAMKVMLEL